MPPAVPTDAPPPSERKSWRMVACDRCKEPLYFPAVQSKGSKVPFLFCRKCGARTAVPTWRRLLAKVAGVLIFLAACGFVIFTFIKEG